jgi:hypothetical protein
MLFSLASFTVVLVLISPIAQRDARVHLQDQGGVTVAGACPAQTATPRLFDPGLLKPVRLATAVSIPKE